MYKFSTGSLQLFIKLSLLVLLGFWLTTTLTVHASTMVESFTATDCVIALGDSTCDSKLTAKASAGRTLLVNHRNSEIYSVFNKTGMAYNTEGSGQLFLIYDSTKQEYSWSAVRPFDALGVKAPFESKGIAENASMISYGLNEFTLTEDGKKVGATTARATCAPGTIWTWFYPTAQLMIGRTGPYVESGTDNKIPLWYMKCMPRFEDTPTNASVQIQYPEEDSSYLFGKDYGKVKGFCPTGESWQFSGKTADGSDGHACLKNYDPVNPKDVSFSINTNPKEYLPDYQSSGFCSSKSTNLSTGSCTAAINLKAPSGRYFEVFTNNKNAVYGTSINYNNPHEVVETDYTNNKYVWGGIKTTEGVGIFVSLEKDTLVELRLGSTTLERIKITPSKVKVPCDLPAGVTQNATCYSYTFTQTKDKVPAVNTNTVINPVNSTSPTNPITTNPLLTGCASGIYNSAYALANCPDGVGVGVTPAMTNSPAITTSLALGSRGTEVETLQKFLVSQNYLASDSVTGYYGESTKAAVQKYQCAKGIVCDGTSETTGYGAVGPSTRASINASNTTSATTQSNSDINALIQSLLAQVQALMKQVEALKAKGM